MGEPESNDGTNYQIKMQHLLSFTQLCGKGLMKYSESSNRDTDFDRDIQCGIANLKNKEK